MSGKVTLKPCNEWNSYPWWDDLPSFDGYGKFCGFPKDQYGNKVCASHTGTSYVYVAGKPAAAPWYRLDY
jgi:hypothetical protein